VGKKNKNKTTFPVCFFFSCKSLWIYLGKIHLNLLLNGKNIKKLFWLKKKKLCFNTVALNYHLEGKLFFTIGLVAKSIINSQFFKNIRHWCHWNDSVTCSAEVHQFSSVQSLSHPNPCPSSWLVGDAIQPPHPLSSPSPPALNLFSIRVFSNESALHIRWPKYWSFSFNISPSNEHPGLISFRMDGSPCWISLQSKGLSRVFSNTTVQKYHLFGTQFS